MKVVYSSKTISVTNSTKRAPRINGARFDFISQTVLGKGYDISLHFVGRYKIKKLNKTYRQKTYATDILSFPYSETSGEIFIYFEKVLSKAKQFGVDPLIYLQQLFIHGLVHLKGYEHGSTMDKKEELIRTKLKLPKIPWH